MKKILLALIVVLALNGCAVLADKRTAAACQIADGATTYYALTHGAVEANPLLSGFSPGAILFLKLGLAYWIYTHFRDYDVSSSGEKATIGALTAIGCLPVPGNLKVIRSLR